MAVHGCGVLAARFEKENSRGGAAVVRHLEFADLDRSIAVGDDAVVDGDRARVEVQDDAVRVGWIVVGATAHGRCADGVRTTDAVEWSTAEKFRGTSRTVAIDGLELDFHPAKTAARSIASGSDGRRASACGEEADR